MNKAIRLISLRKYSTSSFKDNYNIHPYIYPEKEVELLNEIIDKQKEEMGELPYKIEVQKLTIKELKDKLNGIKYNNN